ncbi:MAG: primosomal protein N' [Desulfobacterales bacterium]|nr:primosomal protein N' [Desulfobacteraceae bacterium]MBT7086230.1 primosomal protein N' [Desulfobacterales bacterium]MBT7696940.1 primosomal protein N' [Desulfobacterales bacterium]
MSDINHYIEVAVPIPVYNTFTYNIPESLYTPEIVGKRALVPFGNRRLTGYILGNAESGYPSGVKEILDVLDEKPLFPESMVPFFRWIADYYIHSVGEVVKAALPGGINLFDLIEIAVTPEGEKQLCDFSLSPREMEVLSYLKDGFSSLKTLERKTGSEIPKSLIHKMERSGYIVTKRSLKGKNVGPRMERFVKLLSPDIPMKRKSLRREKVISILRSEGEVSVKRLKESVPNVSGLIKTMKEAGSISTREKRVYRDPFGESVEPDTPPILTEEQNNVISEITGSLGKGFATYMLAGVTGSGKTEVYMKVALEAIRLGYSALVLVPEIALISQTEKRFRARFGEKVAVLHSGLSSGERYDQWVRIVEKDAVIAIGARSAIFAPLQNIGIIIVDEEHDTSYKQESSLRYNARDLAIVRAKQSGCLALLGSATPSVQSIFNSEGDKYIPLYMKKRVNMQPLPAITVVDLRKYRDSLKGARRFITPELLGALKKTLDRGEQALLFLNRRGFANYPVCAACGESLKCKNCDISLTLHKQTNAFRCHFCGYTKPSVSKCSECGSPQIKMLGFGTEKIEEAVNKLFPDARVARLDHDTTSKKGSLVRILKDLKNRKIDVLVGTQMIAKGHDFPDITLVGIICADLSLNFPDFRAGERTFQILSQVSGRAGRGAVPGKVILQTYNPDHFSIMASISQDYREFFSKEIIFRKALNFPPFSRIIQLKISGRDKNKTKLHAHAVGELCNNLKTKYKDFQKTIEILGPVEAPLVKIANRYRWQILLKGPVTGQLHRFAEILVLENNSQINNPHVRLAVDVDPFFMM